MKTCWVLTSGQIGMVNQALGLAEQFPVTITQKVVRLNPLWHLITPYILFSPRFSLRKESDSLIPPWPDLVIACGRQSVLPTLYVKRASGGRTKVVYLQNPVIRRKEFDAIVCPAHDLVKGDNVISTVGAPNRVSQEAIDRESEKFRNILEIYPSPRVSVLIGGLSKAFTMDASFAERLVAQLRELQKRYACSFLITTSRRTPPVVVDILKKSFLQNTYLYTGEGENPYFALLGWGDYILSTCDSVCMVSEAAATTKPVYLLPLEGGTKKFQAFLGNMISTGRIQWFDGNLHEQRVFPPFNENLLIAKTLEKDFNVVSGFAC